MATNFKLYMNEDDIRRIRLEDASWESFRGKLLQLYPEQPELGIRYRDEEGDLITITTNREWETMLNTNKGVAPIKLFLRTEPLVQIVQGNAGEQLQLPTEVAPVEQVKVPEATVEASAHADEGEKEVAQPVVEEFQFLSRPEQPAVPSEEAPLSVLEMDVNTFFERLQNQACTFLNPAENESIRKAKEFFEGLVPDSSSPIVGEITGAVESVKRALSSGYATLSELPEFKDLMALLSGKEEEIDPTKWLSEQETLQAMGFADVEANQALLAHYKGDVQKVVNALLAQAS